MLIYHLYLNADGTIHHADAFDGGGHTIDQNWTPRTWNTPMLFAANFNFDKLAYKGD